MSSLTERALAASLKKLLEKKTLDKITVKDITDDCGVNRQTFYYHFHDVYDLVEWIFLEEARKFRSKYEGERYLKVVVSKLTEQLLENKAFIINAFYSVNRRQLEKFLQELARPALTDIAAGYAEGRHISQEDQEFVVNIFNFALIGLVTEWVGSGMDTAFIKDIDRFYKVLDGTMEGALQKFSLL